MRKSNIIKGLASLAFVAALASCSPKASVSGTVKDAANSEVTVKLLDINRYTVLDTLKTGPDGSFAYKVNVKKSNPEFVYVFYKDTKIASLLLESGDKVTIDTDTLGNCTVSGSEESVKLVQLEKDFVASASRLDKLSSQLLAGVSEEESMEIRQAITNEYISYYRSRVKYILENPYSLTVVPVFYQNFAEGLPVFAQQTDAIHFTNACDSLETVYPDSRYVRALRREAARRMQQMSLNVKLSEAAEIGHPEIELPDVNGELKKLSETEGKVILLHFWSAADAEQKMFNQDVLIPLYNQFKNKGLEIYAVALDTDKAVWARAVKSQNLEWVNVCDANGGASSCVVLYNLNTLPCSFLISSGELLPDRITDEASLRKVLGKLLK